VGKLRKILDERDARRCLAAAEAAGTEVRAWAQAHGIDGRSLNIWRMNLARRGGSSQARGAARGRGTMPGRRGALVELVPAPGSAPSGTARYAVQLGDVRVEFGDDFDPRTLRRVLEVVREC
jgi:hypothetical protein